MILRPEKSDNRKNSVVSLLRCTFLMSQRLRMKVSPPPPPRGDRFGQGTALELKDDIWEEGRPRRWQWDNSPGALWLLGEQSGRR